MPRLRLQTPDVIEYAPVFPAAVMSIFGVAPRRVGGVEMFARELSSQLHRSGWHSVLCFLDEPSAEVRRFLEAPGTSIEVLPGAVHPGPATLRATARLIRKHRPGILHLYFTDFLTPYPWLASFLSVRRTFLTDQTSRPEGYLPLPAPLWKRALGRLINQPLDAVIGISDYNARCCAVRGFVSPRRVRRIYNAVDRGRDGGDPTAFRRAWAIPENRAIVLQVSLLVSEKGIDDLIATARIVLSKNPDVQFVVAGDGPGRPGYIEQARRLGLEDHFTWTGLVADPLGDGVYAAADVVCQLSRWEEAFGWVIAEGMLCGKPVVATHVGGIPEIVEDGQSGFVVPRRRPDEAAEKLLLLLAEPDLRKRMGDASRRLVEIRFNLERNVAELLKLYGI
jgi:glycosyltransferase involved in cell wall biosynthesis